MNDHITDYLIRIASIRQQLGVSRFKNIAIADWELGNVQGTLVAISGQTTRSGTVGISNSPIFKTFEVPQDIRELMKRESKSLKELASRYACMSGIAGKVTLFSEHPVCTSCSFVIEQFHQRFPNITLIITHTNFFPRNF